MRNPELELSLRDRIVMLDIEYWYPDPKRGATEDVFYINTQDKELFDLFNRACEEINKSKIAIEGMGKPLDLFHQIGTGNQVGETGYECLAENIPLGEAVTVRNLIKEKMFELSGLKFE
jgi:hypothetical protein